MGGKQTYCEYRFPFKGDQLLLATRVAGLVDRNNFVLYEHEEEWSLGMGIRARLTVYPARTEVDLGDGKQIVIPNKDLNQSIQEGLNRLPYENWRAYGTADFELARLNFNLPVADDIPLLKLFIPQEEIRVGQSDILIRAFEIDRLAALKDAVEVIVSDEQEFEPGSPIALDDEIRTHAAESYKESVAQSLTEIHAHKYRKVILSRKINLPQRLDMTASYFSGRRANTPARSYLLRLDGLEAGGFSPETVAEVSRDREVFTTPLAGTRSTGEDILDEIRLQEELLSDSKEIAEHAISVYVGFDELTMVCDPATVGVTNFMIVARRGAVQHLASRVKGRLLKSCNPWHAFNALFPAVTASGVPKQGSIEAIGRIEPVSRGLYAGCVMICEDSGLLDAALVLRSFYQRGNEVWLQAGAGIMNMSNPERELEETREKLSSFSRYLVATG